MRIMYCSKDTFEKAKGAAAAAKLIGGCANCTAVNVFKADGAVIPEDMGHHLPGQENELIELRLCDKEGFYAELVDLGDVSGVQ